MLPLSGKYHRRAVHHDGNGNGKRFFYGFRRSGIRFLLFFILFLLRFRVLIKIRHTCPLIQIPASFLFRLSQRPEFFRLRRLEFGFLRKTYQIILINPCLPVRRLMVYQNHLILRQQNIHKLKKLSHRTVIQHFNIVSLLNAVGCQLIGTVHPGIFRHIQTFFLHLDRYDIPKFRQGTDHHAARRPFRGFLYPDHVIFMDRRINVGFPPADPDNCRLSELSLYSPCLLIHRKTKLLPAARKQQFIGKIRLHGCIHHGKLIIIIQLDPFLVKCHNNKIIVLFIIIQTDPEGCHKCGILFDLFRKNDIPHHFFSPERRTLALNTDLFRQFIRITGYLPAAADYKHGADRLVSVQFQYFFRRLVRQPVGIRLKHMKQVRAFHGLGKPHNIFVLHLFLFADLLLDRFRSREIHKAFLRDHFRQGIPCQRDHTVGNDTAVIRDADIGSPRSHIHKRQVQHPVILRNGDLDRGDRLQRQACHPESCDLHRFIKPVDNILRQKGGDQVCADHGRLVPLGIADGIVIHIITDHGISHTVKGHGGILLRSKFLVGLLDRHGFQVVDILHSHFSAFRKLQVTVYRSCPKDTPCRSNADFGKFHSNSLFQFLLHFRDGLPHLPDVVDLPVQHGSCLMLFDPLGDTVKLIALFIAHCPDNTSGSYIQPENRLSRYLFHFCH